MTYDQERCERAFFSVVFQATTEEYAEILRKTYDTASYREHDVIAQLLQGGRYSAFDPRARAMCEDARRLYSTTQAVVRGLVAEMERNRP